MFLSRLSQDELTSYCKKYVETLELWLRKLVHEELTKKYGLKYFESNDVNGQRIIKNSISKSVIERYNQDKQRYSHFIDATTFENLIDILCNPNHYTIFKKYFQEAYPNGENEVRYFLKKLKDIRNKLYHLNPISIREAEQLICYTNDIIESFKINYIKDNMEKEYNSPQFIKFVDSFGNCNILNDQNRNFNSFIFPFNKDSQFFLRPGDILSIEVFVDTSFDSNEYKLVWNYDEICDVKSGNKISIEILEEYVGEIFFISCKVISNKKWHRFSSHDDKISFMYKVLPPIK